MRRKEVLSATPKPSLPATLRYSRGDSRQWRAMENGGCAKFSLCRGAAMPIVVGTGMPNDKAWTWTDGKTSRADYEHDALS